MMNAQTGNQDWDTDMLLGESQYENNANQLGLAMRLPVFNPITNLRKTNIT